MKKKFFALFLIFSFILTSGFGCKVGPDPNRKTAVPVTLKYWRVFDGPDAFEKTLAAYKQLHPNISIEYRKFRYDEYEKELINALAEDRGPDIFSIPSTWMREYQNKLEPMPAEVTLIYYTVQGTVKKEVVAEKRTQKSLTLRELKSKFVDIVYEDAILEKDGKKDVYGLPLYIDTLALFYNQDLLNNADISQTPEHWDTFQKNVKRLTKTDKGKFIQSGVALGTAKNIERSSDILSLLMMQNGATMLEGNSVQFHMNAPGSNISPGIGALRFYTDFADPSKEVYCWNNSMNQSLELFSQGKVAFMFGYSYHLPDIKMRAPKLNFGVSQMPQIAYNSKINHANYWMEVVSNKSKNTDEAWDFVQFATDTKQVKSFLDVTNKPTAIRALIAEQIDDLEIGVFADQVLTAQSWYKGKDSRSMEIAMDEMIEETVKGERELDDIIRNAVSKISATIK